MIIALLGYGKMGKLIESIAIERGHEISVKVNSQTTSFDFMQSDVAIDFSLPNTAKTNIKKGLDSGIPVISGTTGWLNAYDEIVTYCKAKQGAFLYASNFSLGVNIFFEINKRLSYLIGKNETYKSYIEEIHHTQKLDAPSGTAISLAKDIIAHTNYTNWTLNSNDSLGKLPIISKRIPKVPGTHEVFFNSKIDSISIKHTAHNRKGFALGAVIAAEWIIGKKGVYSMVDVLNIRT